MNPRAKPLLVVIALGLFAATPAFADNGGSGGNTNAEVPAPGLGPLPGYGGQPVTGATGHMYSTQPTVVTPGPNTTTVVTPGATTTTVAPAPDAVVVTPAPATAAPMSDDARERAARAATTTSEEEHGGTRNRIHSKKDQAREKMGLGPDND